MKYKKRNKFFVFCFSFIPGAAEMYMGFMKNGLSIMATFVFSIIALNLFWFVEPIFFGWMAVTWFYAFFHAWNLYGLSEEELGEREDNYFWKELGITKKLDIKDEKIRKYTSTGLIIAGAFMAFGIIKNAVMRMIPDEYWDAFYFCVEYIPQFVISILIIIVGVKLIKAKKNELGIDDSDSVNENKIEDSVKEND